MGFPSDGSPVVPTPGVTTQLLPQRVGVGYVTVAASQTAATLASRRGCYLHRLIIQPATTSPGNVILYDGKGSTPTTVYTFPGGASSVADLSPIVIDFNVRCQEALGDLGTSPAVGWYVTTGANVSVVAIVQEQ